VVHWIKLPGKNLLVATVTNKAAQANKDGAQLMLLSNGVASLEEALAETRKRIDEFI